MTERPATGDWPAPAGVVSADWPTVPGYEVLEELGRGGMGVVYRARQVNLKRLVALKLLRDGALAGPLERARFRIEAEAAARMRHPNIVSIYEVGEHQGRPYFAMELVEGGGLDQHLTGQPLPAPQAAELVQTLSLAIQHAHEQKVVHRDLKPANILIADRRLQIADLQETTPPSGKSAICNLQSAILKITDFGLAKRLDSESTAWTQEGAVLGTAGYMAPEQAAGRVSEIGPAADIYALGAILYELLTGQPPFQADSLNKAIDQVLHDEPTPPTRLQPDVPRDLETVCLKCLEKEPDRRYASAAELADDLSRFREGKPVTAVPLSARERLARLAARDGYQLAEEIGRGPRSTAYRALYGSLNQPVALKVFAVGTCTRDAWETRLHRDAELRASLTHPQIIPVYRAGWWDSAPYVAVEHIPQGSLAAKLSGKPFPVRQALRLVEQLAQIVRYLHRQGVVHGNLKPSNVLLAADEIPRIVDFHPTGGLFMSTFPTEPAGLAYLAPEVIRDPGAEMRQYTDIYGLGLILYELLTGRQPFVGSTVSETLDAVREQEPVPPSQIHPDVTPQLEAICLRCLRKNPWKRYSRAYDLLMCLQDLLENSEGRAGRAPI
jgi:serine/threonine protein kinase